jgi:hypothetical protein
MTLFDEIPRSVLRPKYDSESDFEYQNISARRGVVVYREVAERWFRHYPDKHKRDLRARYRSQSQPHHGAAFFELYLHQLFLSIGCTIEVHPHLSGSSSRPDFLVRTSSGTQCYVEAVLADGSSEEKRAAGRRAARVYDCLNQIHSPDFFLNIRIEGSPRTSPPQSRLRQDLEEWVGSLDYDAIVSLYEQGRRDEVPRFPWNHEGWDLEFEPLPKSSRSRGKPGIRPVGIRIPEARWIDSASKIRKAVKLKAGKYGLLDVPLLVFVNVLDWADHIDVLNALIGDEQVTIFWGADGKLLRQEPSRKLNGVFGCEGRPRGRRVSAVAVTFDLGPWTMKSVNPELFHHPWPIVEMPQEFWPMPQWIINRQGAKFEHVEGRTAASLLGLPDRWPIYD